MLLVGDMTFLAISVSVLTILAHLKYMCPTKLVWMIKSAQTRNLPLSIWMVFHFA
jgi:hypothetical protein